LNADELWDYVSNECINKNECPEPVLEEVSYAATTTAVHVTKPTSTITIRSCPLGKTDVYGGCISTSSCVDENGIVYEV